MRVWDCLLYTSERFIQRLAHRAHIPAGQAERIGEALPAGGQHRRQRVGAAPLVRAGNAPGFSPAHGRP